jgi:hypothetical protein
MNSTLSQQLGTNTVITTPNTNTQNTNQYQNTKLNYSTTATSNSSIGSTSFNSQKSSIPMPIGASSYLYFNPNSN